MASFNILINQLVGKIRKSAISIKNKIKQSKYTKIFWIIFFYGFLINFSLLVIFGIPFGYLTFPAWGIGYYFITEEFYEWFEKIMDSLKKRR